MAPKKAKKKNNKLDFEDDESADINLGDIPAAVESSVKAKASAPKKKKTKKKPTAGDWSDDEIAEAPAAPGMDEEDDTPASGRKAAKAAPTFALLQEDADSVEEEEEEQESVAAPRLGGFDALAVEESDEEAPSSTQTPEARKPEEAARPEEMGLVCAEVVKVSRHANADRLKTCQVRTDMETLQVVTNAPNIREGLKVAFAGDGVTTPGSGIQVSTATVRGVKSFGMICSAYDLGWMEEANGFAVELPQGMQPGDALEGTPLKGAILSEEDAAEASGKEKPSKGKKGESKSKKDISNAFDALDLEGEEDGAIANGKHDAAEEPSSNGALADEDEDGALNLLPKPKKGKKKKGVDIAGAFAALAVEDGGEEAPAATADAATAEVVDGVAQERGSDAQATTSQADADDFVLGPKKGKKKKDKKQGNADIDALLAAMDESPSEQAGPGDGEGGEQATGTKKKKKKKDNGLEDIDALLANIKGEAPAAGEAEGDTAQDAAASTATPSASGVAGDEQAPTEPESTSKAKKGKKKGKQAAAKQEEEDLDALLAELGEGPPAVQEAPASTEAPLEAAPEEAAEGKSKGKKAKKKGKQAAAKQDEEDLDALLAELGEGPAAAAPQPAAAESEPAYAAAAASVETAEGGAEEDAAETGEMSAAAKKKAKKKAKEKAKKAVGTAEGDEEDAPVAAPKKGAKKESAAVRRMREALEKQEREAEEARIAEAERIRQEEEAARLAEEVEATRAADAERRKAERLARRAEAKRQGLILTGKAKKEAERLAAMREQILKNANLDEVGEQEERSAPKKVVYGRKKSAKRQDSGEAKTAEEMEQEAAAAKAALEAQRQQEEEQRRQEEEARKAEEEAAARAAAEAHVSESEEDTNWEDMDLDAVKLPGIEEEPSPAEVAKRAAADAAAEDDVSAKKSKVEEEQEEEAGSSELEDEDSDSDEETSSDSDDSDSSDEDSSSEDYSSSEVDSEEARENEQRDRLKKVQAEANARLKAAKEAGSRDVLRSPICCILGHVDTGKTKLLDNVRRTTVQEGEAGGITQQIGATYVPGDAICMRTEALRKGKEFELKLPGLLIIDTPGHESFTNLRSRGSGLCDIAILVVDIMHGMEQQTMESINLLKMRNTPFIVALNKVDRLFEWQAVKDAPIMEALERQKPHVKAQFEQRLQQSILNLNEQGLNVALYWKNPDKRKYVNIVPTSAISGEGIPDMLQLLVRLTQDMMSERLMFISELQCTVLEVKVVEGLGTTVDVVLVNGVLHEGDTIVLCGMNGPIVTNIRSLLTPHPLKELRVKGSYVHHKEIQAAQGVKLAAQNLETAVAGTQLHVLHKPEDLEGLKLLAMKDMEDIFKSVDRSGEGVCVQASTLGSLEALLEFLRSPAVKIPVSGIAIGPIHKKDVMRASVMLEKGRQKFAVILAFDVPVTKEARELAESLGVRIFTADIIYHLFDQFTAYLRQVKDAEQEAAKGDAVFPCILKILPTCVFNAKDPIVLGVDVVEGIAKVGTPICVPSQGGVDLGKIASLELNHKPVDTAKKGQSVAMKIEAQTTTEATRLYGRHFDFKDELVSRISRKSINLLKDHFREDMSKENWQLVMKLKKVFNID